MNKTTEQEINQVFKVATAPNSLNYFNMWEMLKNHLSETYFYTQDMITITRGEEYEKCRQDILKFMQSLEEQR